jgi:osmotically-inducible protein OsmY
MSLIGRSMTGSPVLAILLPLMLAACQPSEQSGAANSRDGVAEQAGKKIDQAINTITDSGKRGVARAKSAGRQAKVAIDDSVIAAQIKTALFKDPQTSGFDIDVNAYRGVVQLSGFVDTAAQKRRAGELAQRNESVISVHNDLIVKVTL